MKLTYEGVLELIVEANTQINLEGINANANLRDLGADSLDLMTIRGAV